MATTMHGAPSPFSREGSRPEDGLGADFGGYDAPVAPLPSEQPWPTPPAPPQASPAPQPAPQQAPFGQQAPMAQQVPMPQQAPQQAWPGYQQWPGAPVYVPLPLRRSSPYAMAALVLGILSVFVFITGPVAIGLGIAGTRQVKAEPDVYAGEGLAIGGIATGAFGSLWLVVIVLMVLAG